MEQKLKGKHFLTCDNWSKEELDIIFDTAFELKQNFKDEVPTRYLRDKTLFMIFFEQSTRITHGTRNCVEKLLLRHW